VAEKRAARNFDSERQRRLLSLAEARLGDSDAQFRITPSVRRDVHGNVNDCRGSHGYHGIPMGMGMGTGIKAGWKRIYGGKDFWKRCALSLEWKR